MLQKSALSVAGILHRPGMKALSIEEMDAGIARAAEGQAVVVTTGRGLSRRIEYLDVVEH